MGRGQDTLAAAVEHREVYAYELRAAGAEQGQGYARAMSIELHFEPQVWDSVPALAGRRWVPIRMVPSPLST